MTDASVAERLARVEDTLALERLIAESTRSIDRGDRERFAATWSDDAVWSLGPPFEEFAGIAAIRQAGEDVLWGPWSLTHHVIGNVDVSLTGPGRATGVSEVIAVAVMADGTVHLIGATYHDEFARGDGGWRIARRQIVTRVIAPLPGVQSQTLESIRG
jgi:ketosteroid isomerase-like protein